MFGDLPRIELFARQKVEGWDCWGNEVDIDEDNVEAFIQLSQPTAKETN
jgi:N6-adenosine-specific RNA methylase IME4